MSSHRKRIFTSIILLPFIVYVIIWAPYNLFLFAVWGLSALCLWEFYSFFWNDHKNLGLKLFGVLSSFFIVSHDLWGFSLLAVFLVAFWVVHLCFLFQFKKSELVLSDNQFVITGLLYIPFAFHFFLSLSPREIFFVLLAAFISDSGAYYCGWLWGKKKVWVNISPQKTWSGSLGGMGICICACCLFGIFLGVIAWYHWIWIGLVLNGAAQLGDFFESALKRRYGVKDSGKFLPGHGGLLDRFDSVLLVLPVYMLLKAYLQPFISG